MSAREQRRLAAIVAADVVGYSRLMGRDEAGTVARLRQVRSLRLQPVLDRRGGRIVKLTGDGALIEFGSAVEALSAAIEFQQAMADGETERPEADRLVFRVGVHLGDVIVDGDDLYGDGVNIAARLEAEAPAGGIVVSGDMHNATAGRVRATLDDLGQLALKNIERPVQAYAVRWANVDWPVTPPPLTVAFPAAGAPLPLPDKPSIAVLPFQNMSSDPEQEYFADGIVEDIITALSRTKLLFVIARNSSFSYKGKAPDIRQVGKELGVRYVLEGSVRKTGNRVRITGQLIDAANGAHLWAERFEGRLEDVFDLQDKVTSHVVASMLPTLERAEVDRSRSKPTSSLVAYDYYLRGRETFIRYTSEGNDEALGYFHKAIEADPRFALALVQAAVCYAQLKAWGWKGGDPARESVEAEMLARRALELDRSHPKVLAAAGWVIAFVCERLEEGLSLITAGVELDPNLFIGWNYRGWMSLALGNNAALEHFQFALRLSPRDPNVFTIQGGIAAAHFFRGNYDETVVWASKVLLEHPRQLSTLWFHAAALGLLGRLSEARTVSRTIMEIVPTVRLSTLRKWIPMARDDLFDELRQGLRLADIPE